MTIEKIGRAMVWSIVAKIARFAAAPVAYIVIVRVLGEHDWGVLSVLKSITGFAVVLVMFGSGSVLLKFVPSLRAAGDLHGFFRSYRKLLLIQCFVWLSLFMLSRWGGQFLGRAFNVEEKKFTFFLQFAIAFVAFEVLMSLISNALQSWYETKRLGIVIVVGNVCYIAFLILFLKIGWGITGVLAAGAVVNFGMSLLLLPTVRALYRASTPSGGEAIRFGRIMRFSLPFVITGILNQIVWRQSEVLFLGHFRSVEEAGYFELAYRIPQLLLEFVPLTIWPIVMAGTSEAYSRDPGNLPRAIDVYYRLLYLMVIPVAAMGFAFARPLVPLLYGAEMVEAAPFTQLFFVVFSYSFLYTPLSMTLYVMEKSWVNMLVFTFLAVVNVGLDLAFIKAYGVWGAFFPVAFVMLLAVLVFRFAVRRVEPDVKAPVSFILRCYVAAVPTGLLAIPAARWGSPWALIILIPAGLLLLFAGFRVMRIIGEKEKELIMRLPLPMKERIVALF